MTDREAMKLAFEKCEWGFMEDAANILRQALAQPEQEPVTHAVIAGVLFDFMGWLTSRQERLVLSASDEASPAVKVIEEFAKMRGLSLDDAKVKDWQDMTTPTKREWVGLTDEEIEKIVDLNTLDDGGFDIWCDGIAVAHIVCAKLKENNT